MIFALTLLTSLVGFASTQIVVIGDTGKDNDGQKTIAEAITAHCKLEKCNYGMLAGDNVYEAGMTSPTDPVLDRVFKKYYGELPFKFIVALGNHDYGKLSNAWEKGAYQLEYAKQNPQYFLPNYYYYIVGEDFVVAILDTTRLMWSKDIAAQERMINEAYAQSQGKWFIVAGHHPYLSNGKHGNAGNYERVGWPAFVSGADVKKFIDKNVCGKASLYISGHDHNLQLTDGKIAGCAKTQFAVSGAGASTESLASRNQTLFQSEQLGYLTVNINRSSLSLQFLDSKNQSLYKTELLSPSLR